MKLLLPILFLSSLALAIDLPRQETYMDKSGWVHILTHDLSTLVVDVNDMTWECESSLTKLSQEDYLRMICQYAPIKQKLRLIDRLARNWARKDKPAWEAINITEEQYANWLLTGTLKTQEELDAAKPPIEPVDPNSLTDIADIQYFMNVGGTVYHQDPYCIDCKDDLAVGVFELMKLTTRQECQKCFGVK